MYSSLWSPAAARGHPRRKWSFGSFNNWASQFSNHATQHANNAVGQVNTGLNTVAQHTTHWVNKIEQAAHNHWGAFKSFFG